MFPRRNEIWIHPEVFQQLFVKGNDVTFRVLKGAPPEAVLEGVHMEVRNGYPMIVATYDRDVEEPTFQTIVRDAAGEERHHHQGPVEEELGLATAAGALVENGLVYLVEGGELATVRVEDFDALRAALGR